MTSIWTSLRPLTWSLAMPFSLKWRDVDLMDGVFGGHGGIGWMDATRELWSMAKCPDGDSGIECTLCKFADASRLIGVVDTTEGLDTIQRDLGKLKEWVHVNLMTFKKAN
ncbi:hypothetical protein WISP_34645 [Willisornis vidua]|uniref:Rna-directed dna polymerase from mobile element jockey-like n=1 Tax=Willisornis vidua TaxID=1566151 RepID=A0ABQ9DPN4_9PASS|nr:hypothetical protein WISP_34645 [Willisornis vidua]